MALNKVEICGVNTSRLPVLTNEEKELLFEKIKKGDKEARELYIKGNLRLVLSVIKRFSGSNENADDLFQIGCIGLMKAIDNFDTTLQVKFSTYLEEVRIRMAKRLLAYDNDMKIVDLTQLVGYPSDGQYFSKIFRKLCGKTPSEYREELKKEDTEKSDLYK